ncbi:MAG TPA: hypothetical protein VFA12_20275 [Stellaceae bacterium]|nr:hypothetical protein [Stellaceae bacterium]
MANGFIQRFKGKILVPAGSLFQFGKSGATFGASGNIYSKLSAAGLGNGNDTTEDTLDSFSLPANSLDVVGRMLYIYAWGMLANNAHSKTAKLYFGSEVVSTGAQTGANVGWALEMVIAKAGANSQVISGQLITGATHGGVVNQSGTETDTSAITLKVTGQTGTAAANDVTLNGWYVVASD